MFKLIRFTKYHCITQAHEWEEKKEIKHVLYVGKYISNHQIYLFIFYTFFFFHTFWKQCHYSH